MAIIGYEQCKSELEALIATIRNDIANVPPGDEAAYADAVIASTTSLAAFEADSEAANGLDMAEVTAIAKLDALSKRIREEMILAALADVVAMIDKRAAELQSLTSMLDQQTAANVSAEKKIRLIPIRNAIISATATVESIKILKKSLKQDQPDEAVIAARINSLITQFGELRSALNNAGVSV